MTVKSLENTQKAKWLTAHNTNNIAKLRIMHKDRSKSNTVLRKYYARRGSAELENFCKKDFKNLHFPARKICFSQILRGPIGPLPKIFEGQSKILRAMAQNWPKKTLVYM